MDKTSIIGYKNANNTQVAYILIQQHHGLTRPYEF